MSVTAVVPARMGSKGIRHKNWTPLCGVSPVYRALDVCQYLNLPVILTADCGSFFRPNPPHAIMGESLTFQYLERPAELASDTAPMIAVVQHVLDQVPGQPDDIFVLLQPTQPLRQPKHVTAAIELLRSSGADTVVSVVELPKALHPEMLCELDSEGELNPWRWWCECSSEHWHQMPTSRQDISRPAYYRDGTVYAFWRRTVISYSDIYGTRCRPLIIPASETCPLDTPLDWAEAERRLSQCNH